MVLVFLRGFSPFLKYVVQDFSYFLKKICIMQALGNE